MSWRTVAAAAGSSVLLSVASALAQTPPAPARAPARSVSQPAPNTPGSAPGLGLPPAAEADTAEKDSEDPDEINRARVPWRESLFLWDQSASGSTVGVGKDYLSRNPSYDMTFSLQPRYYFHETRDQTLSLRADVGVFREFTNSDTTTARGEWSLTDANLFGAYSRELYDAGDYDTDLLLRAPVLVFPTSKASWNNGTILGLGGTVGLGQSIPLLGRRSELLRSLTVTVTGGYNYLFTRARVPTNPDLQRVRMDPEGRGVAGDQLSGVAFARHQATFSVLAELALSRRVAWSTTFSWRPAWKYRLDDSSCIRIQNDCVQPERAPQASNSAVTTLFASEISVRALEALSIAVGYTNLTLQLGPSGERRNVFYSPEARFYLSTVVHLDELYLDLTGQEPRTRDVARGPVSSGAVE